ncbi:MAG: hypothetical protein U9R02_09860, partial [Thermodesulfobacteriota bacterium]|nr:hypothetical protein [Thermodesulfobacteriota bacterium]
MHPTWLFNAKDSTKNNFTFQAPMHPPDYVTKILNMLDIHAFSRLASRAPQHLKLRTYFLPNP